MNKNLDLLLSKHLRRLGVPEKQWPEAKQKLLKFSKDVLAIESDGNYQAANKKSSAKGGYQFLDDSVAPALVRLKRYIGPQGWMDKVGENKDARTLTPQQQELLFFGDLLEKTVKGKKGLGDKYLKGIIAGDNRAAYNLYAEGHHTKPDYRTNVRANKQFNISPLDNPVVSGEWGLGDWRKPAAELKTELDVSTETKVPPTETIYKSFRKASEERRPTTTYTPFGGIKDLSVGVPAEAPPIVPFGGIKESPVETRTDRIFSRPSGRLTPSQQNYYDMMEEAKRENRYNQGGAVNQAQGIASLGRGSDTELVHMTPSETQGLRDLAQRYGGGLSTNPYTGLPEAGFLKNILPMLVGGALSFIPGVGPLAAGALMGGGALAASGGDVKEAAKWGLGGAGGAGIAGSLAGAGTATAGGGVTPTLGNVSKAFTTPGALTNATSGFMAQPFAKSQLYAGLGSMAAGTEIDRQKQNVSAGDTRAAQDLPYYPEGGYTYDPTGNVVQTNANARNMFNAEGRYDWGAGYPNTTTVAQGGLTGFANGGLTRGSGDGMSDDIPAVIAGEQPAALSPGEFVVPADVVSDMGNGSTRAGARQLYSMMDRVRKARGGSIEQPEAINPNEYVPV